MEFYRAIYYAKRGGRTVAVKCDPNYLCLNSPPAGHYEILTWDTVGKMAMTAITPKIKKKRKGRVLWLGDLCVREWREPELDLQYSITYQQVNLSLREILECRNCAQALRYLTEHMGGSGFGIR